MKISCFLVGYKGYQFLQGLLKGGIKPLSVVSYKYAIDDEYFVEISELCRHNDIVFDLKTSLSDITLDILENDIEKIFVVGWQFLIKKDLEKYIIFHDSYLPELRGWCPTPTALINGFDHLGATAFEPTDDVDWGRIYAQRKIGITYPIKLKKAVDEVIAMYVDIALTIVNNELEPQEFPEGRSSYSIWRDREDMFIDWNDNADDIKRKIDALGFPLSGALTSYKGNTIIVRDAEVLDYKNFVERHPSKIWKIVDNCPHIICGSKMIMITDAVWEDKKSSVEFNSIKQRMGK